MLLLQFQVFLVKPPLFEKSEILSESRQQFLIRSLSNDISFIHRGNELIYKPFYKGLRFIGGQIGRQRVKHANAPPAEGFAPIEQSYWVATHVFVDTADVVGSPGQRILFEQNSEIGDAGPIMKSFARALNRMTPDYTVSINPVFNEEDFWTVVRAFEGPITQARFEFLSPNIFGGDDKTQEFLRSMNRDARAVETDVTLKGNAGGLDINSERVKEGVSYCARGGGTAILTSKRKTVARTDQGSQITEEVELTLELRNLPEIEIAALADKLFNK